MTKPVFKNDRGVEIAKRLWPNLIFEPSGGFYDQYGIDAHLEGETVQIKYDSRIASSENVYHEYYEKSAGHPEQRWRKSPGKADNYLFTTETPTAIIGYLVPIDVLAEAETGQALRKINPNHGDATSIGIILPLAHLKTERRSALKGS